MSRNKTETPKAVVAEPVKELTVMPQPAGDAFLARIEPPPAVLAESKPMSPEFSLELAKRRVNQFKGIVKLIASETSPLDLFVFAPYKAKTEEDLLKLKAYLPLHICQSILAWSGALWMPDKAMIERRDHDELGDFIEYDLWVDVMTADNREVRVMGTCSTRHPFHGLAFTFWACPACRQPTKFINRENICEQHGKVKGRKLNAYRPLCDVNRGNVRKHTITNAWNKAVDALGLTPTLRDLKEVGMDIQKIPRANFGSRDDDDTPSSPQQTPQKQDGPPTNSPASQPQQKKPASTPSSQSSSAASTKGPPKAAIPNQDVKIFGGLQKLQKYKKKGTDQVYLKLTVNNVAYFLWDNMTRAIDTKGTTRTVFELLEVASQLQGTPVEFLSETIIKGENTYPTAKNVLRIGILEWEPDGMLVLRRKPIITPPPREPGDDDPPIMEGEPGFEADDSDFPAGLFGDTK